MSVLPRRSPWHLLPCTTTNLRSSACTQQQAQSHHSLSAPLVTDFMSHCHALVSGLAENNIHANYDEQMHRICAIFVWRLLEKFLFAVRMCIWLAQVCMPGAGGGSLVEYYFGKASLLHWTESYWSLLNHSIGPGTLHQPQSRIDIDLLSKGRTSFVDCLQFESMFRGCKYDRFLANCQNLGLWHPASCEYTWNPSLGTFHLYPCLCCVWPFHCELWYCYKWYSVTPYYCLTLHFDRHNIPTSTWGFKGLLFADFAPLTDKFATNMNCFHN